MKRKISGEEPRRRLRQIQSQNKFPHSVCKRCGSQLVGEWKNHVCPDLTKKEKQKPRIIDFAFSQLVGWDDKIPEAINGSEKNEDEEDIKDTTGLQRVEDEEYDDEDLDFE